MKKSTGYRESVISDIRQTCMLTRTRLIARVVTGIYDEALRPYGLNSPQFSLLASIRSLGRPTRAEVGRFQQLDRSTLTRNLQVMIAAGWLEEVDDAPAGRGRPVVLTPLGTELLFKAASGWAIAQSRAEALLGDAGMADIKRVADTLGQAST